MGLRPLEVAYGSPATIDNQSALSLNMPVVPELSAKLRPSAVVAGRSAFVVAGTIFAIGLVRMLTEVLFKRASHFSWGTLVTLPVVFGVLSFCGHLSYSFLRRYNDAPAAAVLGQLSSPVGVATKLSGFVAMEYYALILNRTYVVFVAPDGLYGWKVRGPVTNWNPLYFQRYAEILNDPKLMHNHDAIEKLAHLRGGFVVPRPEIASAELIYKPKWGMGGIPHAGRIRLRFASGRSREFLLLGSVSMERIRGEIVSGSSV